MPLTAIATHLPKWGTDRARVAGPDEDALTLAVAAGRAALAVAETEVSVAVLVTRDVPVLQGGSEAVLLTALGLPAGSRCTVVLGGAPAALDAVASAAPGTLVLAVDVGPTAGAAAVVVGMAGARIRPGAHSERSLPLRVRDVAGRVSDYDDPRLHRTRGTNAALARLGVTPVALAGLPAKETKALCAGTPPPTGGAAAALFALADALDRGATGAVVALEQGSGTVAELGDGPVIVTRSAPPPRPLPQRRGHPGGEIKFSLPAYERAFDAKIGLQAGQCAACGTLALPPRLRCVHCGSEEPHALTPLPRNATIYTTVAIHVPVPGLLTPYDLAVVELGDSGVRALAPVTGCESGTARIGDSGAMVLRKVADRSGFPDYGYAFELDETEGIPT